MRRLSLLAALLLSQASSAAVDEQQLRATLERLSARIEALEKRNAELEKALDSERLSEREPELATRIKSLETDAAALRKSTAKLEALDGVKLGASLNAVLQQAPAALSETGRRQTRASYRGDVQIEAPAGEWADVSAKAFAHLRFGQGEGLALRGGFSSTPNTLAFQAQDDREASFAILAQAGLQFDIPLPRQRSGQASREHLLLTLGKLDPFVYFDANALADDESTRFLNNALVHNPLLDSGGDIGADRFGFAPGAILQWVDERDRAAAWTLSLGVLASGPAARFESAARRPLLIAQAETRRRFAQLPGSYRIYAWQQGEGQDLQGRRETHRGLGLSIDQQLGDSLAVFARWGRQVHGDVRFDRALVAGLEWRGNAWHRGADAIGLGFARLRSAVGSEQIAELYYRVQLGAKLQLTPDLQWISHIGGDAQQQGHWLFGLRAKVTL